MDINITTPDEWTGECINLISTKSGIIDHIENKNDESVIYSTAPLRCLFGFATLLRSSSQGKATFSMQFRNYSEKI